MHPMALNLILAALILLVVGCAGPASESPSSRAFADRELERHFGAFSGGFLLRSLDGGGSLAIHPEKMIEATSPCSTFKVPHALMALEEGLLADRSATVLRWDGQPKALAVWERDHDLFSAMQNSVVWYFQEIARRLGMEREQVWLDRLHFGNADPSSGLETFWLGNGSLKVTPEDQLTFWTALLGRELPASRRGQEEVLDLVTLNRRGEGRLFGKTGSKGADDPKEDLGWFVGGIDKEGGRWVFATRVEGPGAWGPEARKITRAILAELDLWPAD